MAGLVRTVREGSLGWVIFDHEERRNAINAAMWEAIPEAMAEMVEDPEVRVVLLRGAGEVAFVSGADISEFGKLRTGAAASSYDANNGKAFAAVAECPKPVIAMIHGFCVGGGAALSLKADLRYAADDGVFAIPAARLGLGYSASLQESLVATVGLPAAKEIFFTARRFSAPDALRLGLVNEVLPKAELESYVRKVAEGIARNAPLTLRSGKLIQNQLAGAETARDRQAWSESTDACYHSEDYQEGIRAFLEKRPPVFQGK